MSTINAPGQMTANPVRWVGAWHLAATQARLHTTRILTAFAALSIATSLLTLATPSSPLTTALLAAGATMRS